MPNLGDYYDSGTWSLSDANVHPICALDIRIVNNDRHVGNFLIDNDGKVILIDHDYCFPEVKNRNQKHAKRQKSDHRKIKTGRRVLGHGLGNGFFAVNGPASASASGPAQDGGAGPAQNPAQNGGAGPGGNGSADPSPNNGCGPGPNAGGSGGLTV